MLSAEELMPLAYCGCSPSRLEPPVCQGHVTSASTHPAVVGVVHRGLVGVVHRGLVGVVHRGLVGVVHRGLVGVAISSLLVSLVCYLGLRLYFNCPERQVPSSSVLTETI